MKLAKKALDSTAKSLILIPTAAIILGGCGALLEQRESTVISTTTEEYDVENNNENSFNSRPLPFNTPLQNFNNRLNLFNSMSFVGFVTSERSHQQHHHNYHQGGVYFKDRKHYKKHWHGKKSKKNNHKPRKDKRLTYIFNQYTGETHLHVPNKFIRGYKCYKLNRN